MNYDTTRLTEWIYEEGGHFFGKTCRPTSVKLQSNCTALIAHVAFADVTRQLALKAVASDGDAANAQHICKIHDTVTRDRESLRLSTPKFYGYDNSAGCIAMEFVQGPTLLAVLKETLSVGRQTDFCCDHLLDASARFLAELHRIEPTEVGLPPATRTHGSFVDGLQKALQEPRLRKSLGSTAEALQKMCENLPKSFLSRVGNRVLLNDAQPKNVLVPAPKLVRFIDLDYGQGSPAMNTAFVVASLDRLQLRYFSSRATAQIAAWKRVFLQSYFRYADSPETREDFDFFYPWALVRTIQTHTQLHKFLGPLLARGYVRQIKSALTDGALALFCGSTIAGQLVTNCL